ncbi:OTU domain-containing protein [Wolbachia endosymbiont of Pentidionis agamae]|uniref:OTU domain-containing protein n=1 Tax=Wolbachia endosymbiont of Pentidionis agamae TaxID=3110435 RepID=UPI002FCE9372
MLKFQDHLKKAWGNFKDDFKVGTIIGALGCFLLYTVIGTVLLLTSGFSLPTFIIFSAYMLIFTIAFSVLSGVATALIAAPLYRLAKECIKYINKNVESRNLAEEGPDRSKTLDRDSGVITLEKDSKVGSIDKSDEVFMSKRKRKGSGDSSDSGVSLDSKNESETTSLKSYDTAGDGNCFFHAVFGDNSSGLYRSEKAQEMRLEWHKFLSQFNSLSDISMPAPLREQMQKIFYMFLNKPGDLTARSNKIKKLAEKTRKKIEDAECKVQELVDKVVISMHGLSRNDVFNNLKEYAKNVGISSGQYKRKYNSQAITSSFLNNKELYKAYLEAIQNPSYHVFTEEISILASLANIIVGFHAEDIDNKRNRIKHHKIFRPNPDMLNEDYIRNDELWGNKKQEIIHLEGGHYERAEVVEIEQPSFIEKGSSYMYNIVASAFTSIAKAI